MEWGWLLPIIGVLVLVCLLLLIWPVLRRRLLARHGSVFECELKPGGTPDSRWELGLARCRGEQLEWFPRNAIGFRPRYALSRVASGIRAQTRSTGPDGLNGQRVVRLEATANSSAQTWELALNSEALTALLAWLEAAPPSVGRFRS